jgi:hypothetical protein
MKLTEMEKVMVAAIGGWFLAERVLVDEDNAAQVLPVCRVFNDLQQQPWQARVATQVDYFFGGTPRVPSHDFQGENPRSGLHWLYLAMALLKALFWKLGLSPG